MRRQTSKISPFCSQSSSKLTQSIVRDHMVSHYKKVYSAKAAIDTSAPKSMTLSIKYNDRIRQERLKKGGRPQSSHSISQRSGRSSCSSALSGSSVGYDDSPYLCSSGSSVSSPRFGTSFRPTEVVYPSCKASAQQPLHRGRPTSDIKLRSSALTLHRKPSACSLGALGDQLCFKSFQDPAQKTYSGDLLEKHSQHFTQDKPFTPKTLKSDSNSYLSSYRYYRAPRRTRDCTPSKEMGQEIDQESPKSNKHTSETKKSSQALNTEHESSEDEFSATHFQPSRQDKRVKKSSSSPLFDPLNRVSAKDRKSPVMKSITAEEEELMYLEFISAVTEDILSREFISDRVLDRVMQRHIDLNRHKLKEDKMRHLLEVLCKDFKEPDKTVRCIADLEQSEQSILGAFHLGLGDEKERTKESSDQFSSASFVNRCDSPDYSSPLSASTPTCSPERNASPAQATRQDGEDSKLERSLSSPHLSNHLSCSAQGSVEGVHHNQTDASEVSSENHELESLSSDKSTHEELGGGDYERHCDKLEDLESKLNALHLEVSNSGHSSPGNNKEHTASSVSDDDF